MCVSSATLADVCHDDEIGSTERLGASDSNGTRTAIHIALDGIMRYRARRGKRGVT